MAVAEHGLSVPAVAARHRQRRSSRSPGCRSSASSSCGLVVSIQGNWIWPLAFYHVVGGGLWTGVDLFMGFVIGPVMRGLSIPARVELTKRLMPKMLLIMPTLVTMTLASGFQLAR